MRRAGVLVVLGVVASLFVVAWPAAAKTTVSFQAEFKEAFGRAHSKPCSHFLCGTGTVQGFGEATSTWDPTSFEPIEGTNCALYTADRTITLVSDGSTLSLTEEGTVCFPGKSAEAVGALHSFGNPFEADATYTVTRGTGVFRGAKGSGTDHITTAGDAGHSQLSGTLTL
jgi:hypothetical protein